MSRRTRRSACTWRRTRRSFSGTPSSAGSRRARSPHRQDDRPDTEKPAEPRRTMPARGQEARHDRSAIHRDRYGLTSARPAARPRRAIATASICTCPGTREARRALREAVAADSGFALAPAALTVVLRDTGRRDEAKETAGLARSLAADATRRERQHVEAIGLIADGDGPRAFALMREHLAEFPRDALILSGADRYLFYSGGENRQQLQLDLLDAFGGRLRRRLVVRRPVRLRARRMRSLRQGGRCGAALARAEPEESLGRPYARPCLCRHQGRRTGRGLSRPLAGRVRSAGAHVRAHVVASGAVRAGTRTPRAGDGDLPHGIRPAVCKHRSTLNNAPSFLWRCMVYGYAPGAAQWDELQPLPSPSPAPRGANGMA